MTIVFTFNCSAQSLRAVQHHCDDDIDEHKETNIYFSRLALFTHLNKIQT